MKPARQCGFPCGSAHPNAVRAARIIRAPKACAAHGGRTSTRFGDDGAAALTKALRTNNTLQKLTLDGGNIIGGGRSLGSRERHRREPGRVPDAAEGADEPDAQPDADGGGAWNECVT